MDKRLLKKQFASGCSKMFRCKLSFAKSRLRGREEILRSEAYLGVRRNDEE
jgi:hypothetical protein